MSQASPRIRSDILRSAVLGPLPVAVPVIAQIVLYPLILARSGGEMLGLWAVFGTIVGYVTLLDVGFSTYITQVVGGGSREHVPRYRAQADAIARFFFVGTGAVAAIAGLGSFLVPAEMEFAGVRLPLLLMLAAGQIAATGLLLISQLRGAVLSARHYTYLVQLTSAGSTALRFAVAIAGAWIGRPIEGLVVGSALAAAAQFMIYRLTLARLVPEWAKSKPQTGAGTVSTLLEVMRSSWGYYAAGVFGLIRVAVFKAIIAAKLGLSAAGMFEIAERVPRAMRTLCVGGARALLPAFASIVAGEERTQARALLSQILGVIVAAAGSVLVAYSLSAGAVLAIWLPTFDEDLIALTSLLAIFYWVTSADVPFWYFLLGSGAHREASLSTAAHASFVLMLLVVPASAFPELGTLVWYWVLAGLITELLIFYFVWRRSRALVSETILSLRFVSRTLVVPAVVAGATILELRLFGGSATVRLVAAGMIGSIGAAIAVRPMLSARLPRQ